MKRTLHVLLPVVVLGLSLGIGVVLLQTGPEAKRRPARPVVPTVEALTVEPTDYTVTVRSRGTVTPRTQSTLIPEVAGRVVEVATNFRNGGFFDAGQVLARIDPRDYQHAVVIARADLAQARLALRQEQAQGEQAQRDWQRLGGKGKPNDLVLRQPQLASARAAVAAAQVRLKQAQLNLQRTEIRAPYTGRVLDKQVDVGQYVTPGSVIATVYAVDFAEARLPLTDRQAAFVELPESYRDGSTAGDPPPVTLSAAIGGRTYEWQGRIVRTEGAIDTRSRQLFVVAQIDDPYAPRRDGTPPLKVGQFVEARITGRRLSQVYLVPRAAVHDEAQVTVIDTDDRIHRRRLQVLWQDEEHLIAGAGLQAGERLALTPLPFTPEGAQVKIQAPTQNADTEPGGETKEQGLPEAAARAARPTRTP